MTAHPDPTVLPEPAALPDWLAPALDYAERWLEIQRRHSGFAGVSFAAAHRGALVREAAWGVADLGTGEPLTPRHRFRMASHSKTFCAAAVMRLVEAGRLGLDDPASAHVPGLHPEVGAATVAQLLSHAAGLTRDGPDAGQFDDSRPYLDRAALLADLAGPRALPAGLRAKYSNHGFGLLGLIAEAVSGRPWAALLTETVIAPAGLEETSPDFDPDDARPFARGHSGPWPHGTRRVIPAENLCDAMAPAAGVTSTPADLARFFGALDPAAPSGGPGPLARRAMTAPASRDPHAARPLRFGLGLMLTDLAGERSFGHSGRFQGVCSQTAVLPDRGVSVSVAINAADASSEAVLSGVVHILGHFADQGAPAPGLRDWDGRWWSLGGPVDTVAAGTRIHAVPPLAPFPFAERSEFAPEGPDLARVVRAAATGSYGEAVTRLREGGRAVGLRVGGFRLRAEAEAE
ncbi:MAG: serine hydrolase domain-containing protein, partial [Pseudomonadota bacterium]|nr:serine hydrolase domain-containing protein [Pseudomonadota bacterium]